MQEGALAQVGPPHVFIFSFLKLFLSFISSMDAAAAGMLQFPHDRIITQIQFTSIGNLNRSTKRSLVDL